MISHMSKFIPAAERIVRARVLIRKAYEIPIPAELARNDLTYIAVVKDMFLRARDLVKFIPQTAGVSPEMKLEVKKVYEEIEEAHREIFGKPARPKA